MPGNGEASQDDAHRERDRLAPLRRLVEGWALVGGLVLVAVILMNVFSVASGALFGRPLAGDFEMVETGVAVAAFAFLPWCTLTGGHVSADAFTERAGARTKAALAILAATIGVAIAGVLFWRMCYGLADQISYGETTAIISIPLWWAYVPVVASLALLVVAAVIALADALPARDTRHD